MDPLDLIGAVGAACLRERLNAVGAHGDTGVARFMLDQLVPAQVAAICRHILARPSDAERIAMRIPRAVVTGYDLPEHVLTDRRTVAHRHAVCDLPAMLLVNTGDDQGASLADVTLLGVKELTADPKLWVATAATGLGLSAAQYAMWEVALSGMLVAGDWSLVQVADYVATTRYAIAADSKSLAEALGWALPALHLPRDSACFFAMREKDQVLPAKWKSLYQTLLTQRQPLLRKQKPSRQLIESDELQRQFEKVRDDIPAAHHPVFEAFIAAPPAWTAEAQALAELEWEKDGVLQLFSGLRMTKTSLPAETLHFYEFELPKALSDEEKEYLKQLDKRRSLKEARDEDTEFYEKHREELGKDRKLKAKWDRFIYGKSIDSSDFLSALLTAVERLYEQAESFTGRKRLIIHAHKRNKADWLALNADVGIFFCVRYRGLPELSGPHVTWDMGELFSYEELLHKAAGGKKYKRTTSTARNATQIKFDLELHVGAGPTLQTVGTQIVWQGQPDALGMELRDDLDRLLMRPFVQSAVTRKSVSRKGLLQAVSLRDASTFEPAFDKDSGSLVPKYAAAGDISAPFLAALQRAVKERRMTPEGNAAILAAWEAFGDQYKKALEAWRTTGIANQILLSQAEAYGRLLTALNEHARGDVNRQTLLEPVLGLGVVRIEGGAPSALVAPWHPLRLAAFAAKARSVAGLLQHVLASDEVNFGDTRLFFAELLAELAHPYYPEVAVGYYGAEPVLLTVTDTFNEYSLMERPVYDSGDSTTNEDPADAARRMREVIERYLELQPHEHANLSVALYSCDSASLPLAAVGELARLQEEEIHCNVVLRHREPRKLGQVYTELLERAEADPDAVIASETSRNFMSKLRIGIMLDGTPSAGGTGGKDVDVAFLQDVVSRRAREEWLPQPAVGAPPSLLEHTPPRWSYKRSSAEDELKSTAYLACPRQPQAGWAYLDAVAAVVTRMASDGPGHRLPVRQISFQDNAIKTLFDEVHNLAEWVVNYDDLLDKRQLRAQHVNVIRYQRHQTHGRSLVVSSKSEPRVLQVLVKRRLEELGLGLSEERSAELARRLITDATDISGDIVLRAAKRGVFAGELIGVVLSRALIAEELGLSHPTAWFFLDDYAAWLGQKEQGIADLLALSAQREGGKPVLRALVTEAKYVSGTSVPEERRTSRRQLQDTVRRINDALFGDPGRLDRDLWLSRLSDLLLDGAQAVSDAHAFDALRDEVRMGSVRIDLRGYSHVFVWGPVDGGAQDEQEPVPDVPYGLQEVFSRASLRDLLLAYEAKRPLVNVRCQLGDERPWEKTDYRLPSPPVRWITRTGVSEDPRPGAVGEGQSNALSMTPSSTLADSDSRPSTVPIKVAKSALASGVAEPPATAQRSKPAQVAPVGLPASDTSAALSGASPTGTLPQLIAAERGPDASFSQADSWLMEAVAQLRTALLSYSLQAKVLGSRLTPNAALIRLMGSDRLRVEDIESRLSALLTTHRLRIINVSARPGEVVVAVERPERQVVSLWDVWARRAINRSASGVNLSFVIGIRELDGELLYLNLGGAFGGAQQHEPHTLIAGATGSGKSVLLQNLLLDIAATNSSRLAYIYLIDPKMGVDYAAIERLSHVRGGVITEQDQALRILADMVAEMDRRYEMFRGKARDLQSFNAKVPPAERLPVIFVVHDEFADWMMTEDYKENVTSLVGRLGAKARGAGIHLIFAAQRPEASVMPMQLRANLGNRLVLRVSDAGTSEIALGLKGAERLLAKGHLAAKLAGEPELVYAQVPYLPDEEMLTAVEAIAKDDAL